MRRRIALIAVLVLVISGLVAGVALGADPTKRVGLVVGFPDGTSHLEVVTVPVAANAYEVLQAADIDLVSEVGSFGPSVCSINTVGCPASNCFCDATKFWAYYHLAGGAWTAAMEGVGGYVPADGAVEGLAWSGFDANYNPTVQPPVYTFEQLVAITAPTAQPVGVPEPGTMVLMGSGVVGLAAWVRLKRAARK